MTVIPIVTTVAATEITGTGMTLVGSVNPQAQAGTTAWFVWGTTDTYGTATTSQDIPALGVPQTFTAELTGLTTGTTVYFAAVAQGPGGTVTAAGISAIPVVAPTPVNTAMTPAVTVPHWQFPITMTPGGVQVCEQGSFEEIVSNVQMIVACAVGTVAEMPSFGIPDVTFQPNAPAGADIVAAINNLEPRANETVVSAALSQPAGTSQLVLSSSPSGTGQ